MATQQVGFPSNIDDILKRQKQKAQSFKEENTHISSVRTFSLEGLLYMTPKAREKGTNNETTNAHLLVTKLPSNIPEEMGTIDEKNQIMRARIFQRSIMPANRKNKLNLKLPEKTNKNKQDNTKEDDVTESVLFDPEDVYVIPLGGVIKIIMTGERNKGGISFRFPEEKDLVPQGEHVAVDGISVSRIITGDKISYMIYASRLRKPNPKNKMRRKEIYEFLSGLNQKHEIYPMIDFNLLRKTTEKIKNETKNHNTFSNVVRVEVEDLHKQEVTINGTSTATPTTATTSTTTNNIGHSVTDLNTGKEDNALVVYDKTNTTNPNPTTENNNNNENTNNKISLIPKLDENKTSDQNDKNNNNNNKDMELTIYYPELKIVKDRLPYIKHTASTTLTPNVFEKNYELEDSINMLPIPQRKAVCMAKVFPLCADMESEIKTTFSKKGRVVYYHEPILDKVSPFVYKEKRDKDVEVMHMLLSYRQSVTLLWKNEKGETCTRMDTASLMIYSGEAEKILGINSWELWQALIPHHLPFMKRCLVVGYLNIPQSAKTARNVRYIGYPYVLLPGQEPGSDVISDFQKADIYKCPYHFYINNTDAGSSNDETDEFGDSLNKDDDDGKEENNEDNNKGTSLETDGQFPTIKVEEVFHELESYVCQRGLPVSHESAIEIVNLYLKTIREMTGNSMATLSSYNSKKVNYYNLPETCSPVNSVFFGTEDISNSNFKNNYHFYALFNFTPLKAYQHHKLADWIRGDDTFLVDKKKNISLKKEEKSIYNFTDLIWRLGIFKNMKFAVVSKIVSKKFDITLPKDADDLQICLYAVHKNESYRHCPFFNPSISMIDKTVEESEKSSIPNTPHKYQFYYATETEIEEEKNYLQEKNTKEQMEELNKLLSEPSTSVDPAAITTDNANDTPMTDNKSALSNSDFDFTSSDTHYAGIPSNTTAPVTVSITTEKQRDHREKRESHLSDPRQPKRNRYH